MKRTDTTTRVRAFLLAALALGLLGGTVAAQSKEPLLGMWMLDRGQSTFSGAAPDKRTMQFETVAEGIRHTTATVTGGFNEDTYRLRYTFKVDGKDYPADAQMPVSTVAFKRVDANTVERIGKYRGEPIETVRYAVSSDGKTLTVTQKGTLNGAEVTSVQVFVRQP